MLSEQSGSGELKSWVQVSQVGRGGWLQLTNSSQAKHGGAYFSAVFGRKFNPTTVLRPCQPLACCWRVGIASAPTLFTTLAKHHGSRWCGWSDLSLLFISICDTEQILVNKSDKSSSRPGVDTVSKQLSDWIFVQKRPRNKLLTDWPD